MEQLCLCTVILNQFLLNSKLKLGFHYCDISDVYKGRDHNALERLSMGDPNPQSLSSSWTSLNNFPKSDQIPMQECIGKGKCNSTLDFSNFQRVGICSLLLIISCMSSYLRKEYINLFQCAENVLILHLQCSDKLRFTSYDSREF